MVPALMSLSSFSSYNTSKLCLLHPWLTCCLAKTKHLSMPSLEQCMWWTDRWYTSAKSLLVFPNVPQMAWTEPWTESMNTPALDRVWTLPSSSWTFSLRCNFIQNLTILYLWNMSSSDRIGWKGTTNRRCIQQTTELLRFSFLRQTCPFFPSLHKNY